MVGITCRFCAYTFDEALFVRSAIKRDKDRDRAELEAAMRNEANDYLAKQRSN